MNVIEAGTYWICAVISSEHCDPAKNPMEDDPTMPDCTDEWPVSVPLYEGSTITASEAVLLVLQFSLRFAIKLYICMINIKPVHMACTYIYIYIYIYVIDNIAWKGVLYGLYSHKPEGQSSEGEWLY